MRALPLVSLMCLVGCAPDVEIRALDLGELGPGDVVEARLTVLNRGAALSFLSFTGADELTMLEAPADTRDASSWVVRFQAREPGPIAREVIATFAQGRVARFFVRGNVLPRCEPMLLDLGDVGLGDVGTQLMELSNPTDAGVTLPLPRLAPPFSVAGDALIIGAGEAQQVEVRFTPTESGPAETTWRLRTRADCSATDVTLRGMGLTSPLSLSARRVDFGVTTTPTRRTVTLLNHTRSTTTVREVHIDDPHFSLVTPQPLVVPALGVLDVELLAEPTDATPVEATMRFDTLPLGLAMNRTTACLTPSAPALDFPTTELGCRSTAQPLTLTNTCSTAVVVRNLRTDSTDFALVAGTPRTLAPGSALPVMLSFGPTASLSARGALQVRFDPGDGEETLSVALTGLGAPASTFLERFTTPRLPDVEVLLVLDDGPEMYAQRGAVAQNLELLRRLYLANALDATRFGVLTTAPSGRLRTLPSGAPAIDGTSAPDFAQLTALTGTQSGPSSCLDAVLHFTTEALATFHRPGAALTVVCISARPDATTAARLERFTTLRQRLPPGTQWSFVAPLAPSACAPTADPQVLAARALVDANVEDLCTEDWAKWVPHFINSFGEIGYRTWYWLDHRPDLSRGPLRVFVDGVEYASPQLWRWDPADNSVHFEPVSAPAPGRLIEVEGTLACQ